jgi:hypothetical protein
VSPLLHLLSFDVGSFRGVGQENVNLFLIRNFLFQILTDRQDTPDRL